MEIPQGKINLFLGGYFNLLRTETPRCFDSVPQVLKYCSESADDLGGRRASFGFRSKSH